MKLQLLLQCDLKPPQRISAIERELAGLDQRLADLGPAWSLEISDAGGDPLIDQLKPIVSDAVPSQAIGTRILIERVLEAIADTVLTWEICRSEILDSDRDAII
jgi:hypothetical protein